MSYIEDELERDQITEEIEESYLESIVKAIRTIFSNNTFMISKVKDTKKPTEDFIGKKPLDYKALIRDYHVSVYHTNREIPNEYNGADEIKGLVYIDFSRKIANTDSKDNDIPNALDRFVWTGLKILYQFPNLLDTCESWVLFSKQIAQKTPTEKSDTIQEEKLLHVICRVCLICNYTDIHRDYE